jgi:hypothetical protein
VGPRSCLLRNPQGSGAWRPVHTDDLSQEFTETGKVAMHWMHVEDSIVLTVDYTMQIPSKVYPIFSESSDQDVPDWLRRLKGATRCLHLSPGM